MIKMFAEFRRWCVENNVQADQIEIAITPKTMASAAEFEAAWYRETRGLTMRPANYQLPTEGHMYGIPFRYRRPEQVRPFGNSGVARG